MSADNWTDDAGLSITEFRERFEWARDELHAEVRRHCPGQHHPTQHRDGKPPWCNACGRDDEGLLRNA